MLLKVQITTPIILGTQPHHMTSNQTPIPPHSHLIIHGTPHLQSHYFLKLLLQYCTCEDGKHVLSIC